MGNPKELKYNMETGYCISIYNKNEIRDFDISKSSEVLLQGVGVLAEKTVFQPVLYT